MNNDSNKIIAAAFDEIRNWGLEGWQDETWSIDMVWQITFG
jgi:hypothetical protein